MEKDRVFFWSVLFFIVGIGGGSFFSLPFVWIALVGSAFLVALFSAFPTKHLLRLTLFFWLLLAGMGLAQHSISVYQTLTFPPESAAGVFRVLNDPEEKEYFQKVILRVSRCESEWCPKKDILWQAPLSFAVQAGDRVRLRCQFEAPKNFDASFDYRMFLAKNGIGYVCERASQPETLVQDRTGRILAWFFVPKKSLERALSQTLPEPQAGLAKGLLLGGSSYLPESLEEQFTRIGLSHMVAVSGYNITLLAQGLLWIGLLCGLWRKHALWSAVCGIAFFIMMIGAPASALRAGIMAGVVFAALQAGRLARPLNALLLAAALMLVFHPLLLRYDLGFQLSFLATLALLEVSWYLERFLPQAFFGKSVLELMMMTVAVELFVLPVILFSFHTFSPLVIIGNFLVLLVPFAMGLAFVTAVLFLFLPGVHLLFSWLGFGVLWVITASVEWLGHLGHSSITVSHFGVGAVLVWYGALFVVLRVGKKYTVFNRYAPQ